MLISLSATLFGQEVKIVVTDSATARKLPYANIYFKTAGIGTTTNADGAAVIDLSKVPKQDTLLVSYVGYELYRRAYAKSSRKPINVEMIPAFNVLTEVTITYERPPNSVKIIREAIKNVRQNYPTDEIGYRSLYRETIEENGAFIQLNEAIMETYYTAYPQKKLDSKIWKDWYYDDSYAFDLQGNRYIMPLLNDFNTKRDRQMVIASRHSKNLSQFGIENALAGDPLLLFALDKIKYQYDFLYPKLLNKYHFNLEGEEELLGELCYVISFFPKATNRRFIVDQSKKNARAIYVGRVFIGKKSKAVTKFEYQLAVDRDFGFFARRVPLDFRVDFHYQKVNDRYYVNTIKQTSTKVVDRQANGEAVLHKMNRELYVLAIETEKPIPPPDSTLFKSTRFSSIQYYPRNYNPSYWDTLDLTVHLALSRKLVEDLEGEEPLEDQLASFATSKKSEIEPPEAEKVYHAFRYHDTTLVDSLHWMAMLAYEDQFKAYLTKENEYALNEIVEDKAYQRKLFDQLNNFYPILSDSTLSTPVGAYIMDEDSLGNSILSYRKDSTEFVQAVNFSEVEGRMTNVHLKEILPNQSKTLLTLFYAQVGSPNGFALVLPFGESQIIDSLSNVYSIAWARDSILVYAEQDEVGRAGELYARNVTTAEDSLLFSESDRTFDIELARDGEHLFCTVQSKTENEIYHVSTPLTSVSLTLLKARESGVLNTIKSYGAYYLLVSDEEKGSSFLRRDYDVASPWETIAEGGKNFHVEDFTLVGNRLVVSGYEKSIPKLKFLKRGTTRWQELDVELGIGQYFLDAHQVENESMSFTFSSPSFPSQRLIYHFEKNVLEKKEQIRKLSPNEFRYNSIKRLWASSHDGEEIPITLIKNYAVGTKSKGLILKTYGAYGANTTPGFYPDESILLQQGYTIAYAHVRGESILGRNWYKQGRVLLKKNAILDYLACAEYLINKKITTTDRLVGYGNSAGGLVVAQAANLRPDLFQTIVLDHPYLDVVNTMMNDSLPLTVDEYKEWGNPSDKEVFDYIMEYSPYQNIWPQDYPNVLLIAGFQDIQTPAWQIAKYAAKLRANNLCDSKIVLRTDMSSGHAGSRTGKEWIRAFAEEYSFVKIKLPE